MFCAKAPATSALAAASLHQFLYPVGQAVLLTFLLTGGRALAQVGLHRFFDPGAEHVPALRVHPHAPAALLAAEAVFEVEDHTLEDLDHALALPAERDLDAGEQRRDRQQRVAIVELNLALQLITVDDAHTDQMRFNLSVTLTPSIVISQNARIRLVWSRRPGTDHP